MKFGVVVFPGSNCDRDCQYAAEDITGEPARMIWHKERSLGDVDAVILPGGFSYGDYLRTGSIARFSPIMDAVIEFANKGGLVLGICNGFQILLEAGLLPGAMRRNAGLHFVCKDVFLRVESVRSPFTNLYNTSEVIRIPVAHGDGNYYIDDEGLAELQAQGQIVFRYEDNPNGSLDSIAGICNRSGNVLGMMPHPERASATILGNMDGARLFLSMVRAWKKGVATYA